MAAKYDARSDFALPCLFLATTGGAYWSVARMGGQGCGWTSGLMWGLAWRYLSVVYGNQERRAFGSGWFVLAMVAGMYFGGMHGYGQFHSWVEGVFHLDSDANRSVPINPLAGYWWNALCGLGWGGVAAVFLVWSGASRPFPWWKWVIRIGLVVGMAWAFKAFAEGRPNLVMPLHGQVDYRDPSLCPDCARTVETIVESLMWLGFCLGELVFEVWQRNWRNVAFIGTVGVGFALAFTMFEWFHTLPNLASTQVGWWKYWETAVGTIGGLVLGLCFFLYNQPLSPSAVAAEGIRIEPRHPYSEWLLGIWWPLLVSGYKVMENEGPRLVRMVGGDPERHGLVVLQCTFWALVAIGLAVALRTWRDPNRCQRRNVAAAVFVVPYILLFLASYVPLFGKAKIWTNWALPIQLLVYAFLFLTGLACFVWIWARTRPAAL